MYHAAGGAMEELRKTAGQLERAGRVKRREAENPGAEHIARLVIPENCVMNMRGKPYSIGQPKRHFFRECESEIPDLQRLVGAARAWELSGIAREFSVY